jgi:molybdate transport system substrate-binding protein
MGRFLTIVLAVSLSTCQIECTRQKGGTEARAELMLFCGAGLRDAMETLIDSFEVREPVSIQTSYDGSGRLLAQLSTLKRGDVFVPGEDFYLKKAQDQGLIVDSLTDTMCYFVPVLFVRKGNPKKLATLTDLAAGGLRVGFGDERACAVGKVTSAIVVRVGVDSAALARNVVLRTGTVGELGAAVQLQTVDAVVVWESTARQFAQHGDIVYLPAEESPVTVVPAAVLRSCEHRELAARFVRFLGSAPAKEILESHNYTTVRPKGQ